MPEWVWYTLLSIVFIGLVVWATIAMPDEWPRTKTVKPLRVRCFWHPQFPCILPHGHTGAHEGRQYSEHLSAGTPVHWTDPDPNRLIALDFEALAERFTAIRRGGCVVHPAGDEYPTEVRVSSLGFDPDHPEAEKWGLTRRELAAVLDIGEVP